MDSFFNILYKASLKEDPTLLGDYELSDLESMISLNPPPASIIEHFMLMAAEILKSNPSPNEIKSIAIKFGLTDKFTAKIKNHWENNQVAIMGLKTKEAISSDHRFRGMDYSLRTKFYTKADEFKNQEKYATIRFKFDGATESPAGSKHSGLVLNCKEQNLRKIKKRLDAVYKKLEELFAEEDSGSDGGEK